MTELPLVVNARFLTQRMTGVQRYAAEISRCLKSLAPAARFVCPRNVVAADLAETLRAEPFGWLTGHLWEQIELPAFLRRNGSPVLLNLANTAPVRYIRSFLTIHDVSHLRNPNWFSFAYRTVYRILTPLAARRAVYLFTDSLFSKAEIRELLAIPEDKIGIIPCAVSDSLFRLSDQPLPNRYGRYALAVSSLDPRKNFERLLEAFSRLDIPDCKLVLVGGENPIFGHSKLAHNSDNRRVVFAGYVSDPDLAALYRHALCLVYPSLYEGFGMPPLEAMAFGCPVIAANAASLPEACGPAAVYCDPLDPGDIAAKIETVLKNEAIRNELRRKGLEQVRSFSWEQSAKEILSAIHRISGH